MGRRSIHTQDELRSLILTAARQIIERDGLFGFSAREIARSVGYSPGTIYNIFDSLDELLLLLQAQILGDVVERLRSVPCTGDHHAYMNALGGAYVRFAVENSRLWNLLVAHQVEKTTPIPPAIQEHLDAVAGIVGKALKPLMNGASEHDITRAAQSLWTGVHGITAIAVTGQGANLTPATADEFVRVLTTTFTKGLTAS
jgi:AcrR family transcriptional regulator